MLKHLTPRCLLAVEVPNHSTINLLLLQMNHYGCQDVEISQHSVLQNVSFKTGSGAEAGDALGAPQDAE